MWMCVLRQARAEQTAHVSELERQLKLNEGHISRLTTEQLEQQQRDR